MKIRNRFILLGKVHIAKMLLISTCCFSSDPFPIVGDVAGLLCGNATVKSGKSRGALQVFVAGLSQGDPEEEIGDWFSQWGLVSMVKKLKVTRQNQVCLFQNLLIFVKTEAAAKKNWLNFD